MSHKSNHDYPYLILMLPYFKKFIYLRVVYICMNDVDKEEDYPDYKTYVKKFYKQYENCIGFERLQSNMQAQDVGSKLDKLKKSTDFEDTIGRIYIKLVENRRLQSFLSDDEFYLLNVHYQINWIRIYAESLYKFNSMFFLPYHVNSMGNIDLKKICKKLHCTDQRIKLKKYFFSDIRNALSHADYHCELYDNKKFKYIICNTGDGVIKLDIFKMMLITKKMSELISIQGQLIEYYR